jgi:hypothetical protein
VTDDTKTKPITKSAVPEVQTFGEVYVASNGLQYVRIKGVGARLDHCKPFRATVSTFEKDAPAWHKVELTGFDRSFLIYRNWINEFGELRVGDEVEGLINTADGRTFLSLRKISVEQAKAIA